MSIAGKRSGRRRWAGGLAVPALGPPDPLARFKLELLRHRRVLPPKAVMEMLEAVRKKGTEEADSAKAGAGAPRGELESPPLSDEGERQFLEEVASGAYRRGADEFVDAEETTPSSSSLSPTASEGDLQGGVGMIPNQKHNAGVLTYLADAQRSQNVTAPRAQSSSSTPGWSAPRGAAGHGHDGRAECVEVHQAPQSEADDDDCGYVAIKLLHDAVPRTEALDAVHSLLSILSREPQRTARGELPPQQHLFVAMDNGSRHIELLASVLAAHNEAAQRDGHSRSVAFQPAYLHHDRLVLRLYALQQDLSGYLRSTGINSLPQLTLGQATPRNMVLRLQTTHAVVLHVERPAAPRALATIKDMRNMLLDFHLECGEISDDEFNAQSTPSLPPDVAIAVLPPSPSMSPPAMLTFVVYSCAVGDPSRDDLPLSRANTASRRRAICGAIIEHVTRSLAAFSVITKGRAKPSNTGSGSADGKVQCGTEGRRVLDELD